ncbi:MAG: hypothetical protein GX046_06380 [Tissierellia bacterium]|jgi:hypothetical protein|nr:hypothetical protein [Tissierellia bacterium]
MIKELLEQKRIIKKVKKMLKEERYKDIEMSQNLFIDLVTLFKDDGGTEDLRQLLKAYKHTLIDGVWKPNQ